LSASASAYEHCQKANIGLEGADDRAVEFGESPEDCAAREPELMENEEGKAKFDQCVDDYLKLVGFGEQWAPDIRHHQPISTATLPNGKPAMPPGHEAFLYMAIQNGEQGRFEYLAEMKKVSEFVRLLPIGCFFLTCCSLL